MTTQITPQEEHEAFTKAGIMRGYVCDFSSFKLAGHWSGSSHGFHPRGVIRNGILFQDDWNTNNYVYIKIPDRPDIAFANADHFPQGWGNNPTPKPTEGVLHTVWDGGRWTTQDENIKNRVRATFGELLNDLEQAREAKTKRDDAERAAREQAEKQRKETLSQNWA